MLGELGRVMGIGERVCSGVVWGRGYVGWVFVNSSVVEDKGLKCNTYCE